MDEKHASFIIDFETVKEQKQKHMENALMELYEKLFTYIDKEANIREKVRAKQIFSHKTGIPAEYILEHNTALHFEHWFAFDYITVTGSRMFDLFVREKQEELTKPMLDLSGFMMLMALEPVHIKAVEDDEIIFSGALDSSGGEREAVFFLKSSFSIKEGDTVFLRIVRAGFKNFIIGPPFAVADSDVADILSEIKTAGKEGRVRKYLKESGIDYLRHKKG
ncbi:hypothetical protein MM300_03580 [Evansella sp. LMS18]|uniref:hypothetical protein n=1 Tax=Evansella sp. LMS18 TaxID=2924033 RepID=UPI0020D00A96|nr:hypothetical protein [Evansella sp. LMS18]UTR11424.1 hypothetical protein MM300_03580 [Evansella sp. LMS18]